MLYQVRPRERKGFQPRIIIKFSLKLSMVEVTADLTFFRAPERRESWVLRLKHLFINDQHITHHYVNSQVLARLSNSPCCDRETRNAPDTVNGRERRGGKNFKPYPFANGKRTIMVERQAGTKTEISDHFATRCVFSLSTFNFLDDPMTKEWKVYLIDFNYEFTSK